MRFTGMGYGDDVDGANTQGSVCDSKPWLRGGAKTQRFLELCSHKEAGRKSGLSVFGADFSRQNASQMYYIAVEHVITVLDGRWSE
jgi:hypothetical protein